MDKPDLSPERPMPKVTYLDRQKRKRTITEDGLSDPLNPTSTTATPPRTPPSEKENRMMKVATMPAPALSKVDLPGPAPKRARRNSNESVRSTTTLKHKKSASSVSITRAELKAIASTAQLGSPKKPPSIASAKRSSSRRPGSPETEADDNASIADSTTSVGRIRRSEAQRIEYLKNEPLCGALTKDSAECKRCGKSVRLGGRTTYRIRPWEMHRAKCDQTPLLEDDASDDAEKSKQRAKTEEQRIDILTNDPNVSSVKPHEVLCRNCGTWIRLSNKVPYKLANWKAHTQVCQTSTKHQPSDRVAAATRKLRLVNDSQVKSYTEHAVVCAYCNVTVTSSGKGEYKGEYNLLAWVEHKATCTRTSPKVKQAVSPSTSTSTSDISTVPFPTHQSHFPASVTTEAVTVALCDSQGRQTKGTKRHREEDDSINQALHGTEERPTTRARTEAPEASIKGSTNTTSWLALPFQAFIRGFKESLTR
ncbi:hypothetical protein H0H92_006464 [Tricholoma furcatifolium]|nr:hypothetical protein H0H92_006464 [Tricholoma furcatifolium]